MKKQLLLVSIAVFLVSAYAVFTTSKTATTVVSHNEVSYTNDIRPLLENRCGSCHMGWFATEGLNMESYESLMKGSQDGPVIVPGDAHASLIVKKLTSGQMPKRGPKLTSTQIQLISDWINAGAPNN